MLNTGKKVTAFTAIALLTTGLTACNGNNEGALNTRDNNTAQPIGYHTNENGNMDNEGPITEMMDGMNNEGNTNQRNTNAKNNRAGNNNQRNMGATNVGNTNQRHTGATNAGNNNQGNAGNTRNGIAENGNNLGNGAGDNRYSREDANYHGHLNPVGYNNNGNGNGEKSDKIKTTVEKIDNVDEANVLVTDDNIIVAVDTQDKNDKQVKDQITSKLRKMADGRNIQVVTDEATLTRVRNINNNMENGNDRKTIDTDINNLMNDLGDAIQRPFNGNRD